MRVWLALGLIVVVVGAAWVWRKAEPTERERLELACNEGSVLRCIELGTSLVEQNPEDVEVGLRLLDRACSRESGPACFLRGHHALRREVPNANEIAADAFAKGCKLLYFDACAYAGELKRRSKAPGDIAAGAALFSQACENGSALGCNWLGELAFEGTPSRAQREASTRAFVRGCELGMRESCLRKAQALACGRGIDPSPSQAIEMLKVLCEGNLEAACDQQIALEAPREGAQPSGAQSDSIMRAAYEAAQSGDAPRASQLAGALTGKAGLLARASVALSFGNAAQAELLLAKLDADGGVQAIEIARQTLAVVKEGNSFPDAAWLAWSRAGRPDLRNVPLVPSMRELPDLGACVLAVPLEPLLQVDDFLRAVAFDESNSLLDAPFDPEIVRAAIRFSTTADLPARLTALAVLKQLAQREPDDSTREFEAAARRAFAVEHGNSLFYGLLKLPADLRSGSASAEDVAALERALTLPAVFPRRELFDRFSHVLGDDLRSKQRAFMATVFVIIELHDLDQLPGWLERGGHSVERRAEILSRLGELMTTSEWLVDNYRGLRLQRVANELVPENARKARIAALDLKLKDLRTGPNGYMAMGNWPWPQLGSPETIIDGEMTELTRLKSLSYVPR